MSLTPGFTQGHPKITPYDWKHCPDASWAAAAGSHGHCPGKPDPCPPPSPYIQPDHPLLQLHGIPSGPSPLFAYHSSLPSGSQLCHFQLAALFSAAPPSQHYPFASPAPPVSGSSCCVLWCQSISDVLHSMLNCFFL